MVTSKEWLHTERSENVENELIKSITKGKLYVDNSYAVFIR